MNTLVKAREFSLSKPVFIDLNRLDTRNKSTEPVFRGEADDIHQSRKIALAMKGNKIPTPNKVDTSGLNHVFQEAVEAIANCSPFEQGISFFLFGALKQFFFTGNKRTSHLMMNGILMSHGIDAISVPASQSTEFHEKMARFSISLDATEIMDFLMGCHISRTNASTSH